MAQAGSMFGIWNTNPARHTAAEDLQGLLAGSLIAALGLYLLAQVGLVTSGMAGLAFVLHYSTGISFGLLFFLFNLPFYWLAFRRVGLDFTLKTLAAVGITSALVEVQNHFMLVQMLNPVWAAVLGGVLVGFGLLALYRHRASLGGLGILAIYIQDRFGIRAGLVQLAFDLVVMACAFFVVSPMTVLYSIIGAVVLNLFVAINHRSDRYIALR